MKKIRSKYYLDDFKPASFLAFANKEGRYITFLDSNGHQNNWINRLWILAFDCKKEIKPNTDCLKHLNTFVNQQTDWLFGYLSYDLKNEIEALTSSNSDRLRFAPLHFYQPKLVLYPEGGRTVVEYHKEDFSEEELIILFNCAKNEIIEQRNPIFELKPRVSFKEYATAFNAIKQHIQKGNVYELNLCMEFYQENIQLNTVELFNQINNNSGAPFSSFCSLGEVHVIGASPERFLKKQAQHLLSQPIKGTAKRHELDDEDKLIKSNLKNSLKEQTENVMIVDLVRNDLSRLAKKGSVKVEEMFGLYSYKTVHQLISTVSAELKKEYSFVEIIKAMFPMGSMTGAPKISAMHLIEKYEKTKRGLYSGAIGYIAPNGDFDFNVVIRSLLYNSHKAYLSLMVGSAITSNSELEAEYQECLLKANSVLKAIESIKTGNHVRAL